MFTLSDIQLQRIIKVFQTTPSSTAHQIVWSRRSYAPQLIYESWMGDIRKKVEEEFPNHVIAFDVIFETQGNEVAWHCDYESLGPFELVNGRYNAMLDDSFLSIHFNLTSDGGSLTTLSWPRLSHLHYICICYFGIFSLMHKLMSFVSSPLFAWYSHEHSNTVGKGNVFNNIMLHYVTRGKPRTSYVIRLVKKRTVKVSKQSIYEGIGRSSQCAVFRSLLPLAQNYAIDVANIRWSTAFT